MVTAPGTYQFTLIQGSTLLPGLQLSSSGLIFGTPTTGGSYEFAVQVISISPFGGNPVTASAEISINISAPPLTLTTTSLPAGSVGVPYSQTLAASGGFPPYAWQLSSGNTPGGLTLNQYSGTISGTPATAGSFSFQVKVYDSQQGSATGSFTIRIAAGAFTITTSSLPAGTVGTAYTGRRGKRAAQIVQHLPAADSRKRARRRHGPGSEGARPKIHGRSCQSPRAQRCWRGAATS